MTDCVQKNAVLRRLKTGTAGHYSFRCATEHLHSHNANAPR